MPVEQKVAILSTLLDSQIEAFAKKRVENKRLAFGFHVTATTLSATVTVILGWQGLTGANIIGARNVALLFSAAATLAGTWAAFFTPRALWVRYTATLASLLSVKGELQYRMAGDRTVPEAEVDRLYAKAQAALTDTNAWWFQQRSDDSRGPTS